MIFGLIFILDQRGSPISLKTRRVTEFNGMSCQHYQTSRGKEGNWLTYGSKIIMEHG
jgi:hypothetical protein